MIRQIYRFLSITLILNLVFIPAGITKSLKNSDKVPENVCQDKNQSDKAPNNPDKNQKNEIEKMPTLDTDDGRFTTLYGVQSIKDIYNSYPPPDKQ